MDWQQDEISTVKKTRSNAGPAVHYDELAEMLALPSEVLSHADKAFLAVLLLWSLEQESPFDLSANKLPAICGSTNGLDRLKSIVPKGYFFSEEHKRGKGWHRLKKGD